MFANFYSYDSLHGVNSLWTLSDELRLEVISRWASKEKEAGSKEKDVRFQIPASSAS